MKKRDLPIWLGTKLVELLYKDGRVVGATVERRGRIEAIGVTKAVILTAGGFEQNQSLREKYLPGPTNVKWSGGSRCNTGDAIAAAGKLGAALRLMSHAWWSTTIRVPGDAYQRLSIFEKSLPGNYVVDSRGQRIANESQNYMTNIRALHLERSKGSACEPYYMIFDARHRRNYLVGPLLPGRLWPDALIPKRYFEDNFLTRADTLEELASRIGVDRDGLISTVKKVNAYASTGEDLDFHRGETRYDRYYSDSTVKPNPCLAALDQPPFYAMKIDPGDFGTQGGLVIDDNARVLREDASPIPGLYAAGNCTVGILTTYPGPGATLGPAMTVAYRAARHIASPEGTQS
jgi:3-oxosteroid 1-dehydrogenase